MNNIKSMTYQEIKQKIQKIQTRKDYLKKLDKENDELYNIRDSIVTDTPRKESTINERIDYVQAIRQLDERIDDIYVIKQMIDYRMKDDRPITLEDTLLANSPLK